MTDWIKAMNPTTSLTTESEALDAARIGTVGLVLGALNQAVAGWYTTTDAGIEASRNVVEQMLGQAPSPEQMAQQAQSGLVMTGVLVALQLGLALLQWSKPNKVIPIIFLVLVILGLVATCVTFLVPAMAASQPLWLTLMSVAMMVIGAITYIASIRGVSALNRIQMAAAQ